MLAQPPQRMNERVPKFFKCRGDLETMLSSSHCDDWIKISEMFLGKVPDGFQFQPKHKAHGYKDQTAAAAAVTEAEAAAPATASDAVEPVTTS